MFQFIWGRKAPQDAGPSMLKPVQFWENGGGVTLHGWVQTPDPFESKACALSIVQHFFVQLCTHYNNA